MNIEGNPTPDKAAVETKAHILTGPGEPVQWEPEIKSKMTEKQFTGFDRIKIKMWKAEIIASRAAELEGVLKEAQALSNTKGAQAKYQSALKHLEQAVALATQACAQELNLGK